jgi:hypothetical protein
MADHYFRVYGELKIDEFAHARAEVFWTWKGMIDRDRDSIYGFELDKDLMKKLMFSHINTNYVICPETGKDIYMNFPHMENWTWTNNIIFFDTERSEVRKNANVSLQKLNPPIPNKSNRV